MSDFPRNVYVSPGSIKGNHGKTYDTIIVKDDSELKDALAEGYVDSFYDALFPKEEVKVKTKKAVKKSVVDREEIVLDRDDF